MRPHIVVVWGSPLRASLDRLLTGLLWDRWQILAPLLAGTLRFHCGSQILVGLHAVRGYRTCGTHQSCFHRKIALKIDRRAARRSGRSLGPDSHHLGI